VPFRFPVTLHPNGIAGDDQIVADAGLDLAFLTDAEPADIPPVHAWRGRIFDDADLHRRCRSEAARVCRNIAELSLATMVEAAELSIIGPLSGRCRIQHCRASIVKFLGDAVLGTPGGRPFWLSAQRATDCAEQPVGGARFQQHVAQMRITSGARERRVVSGQHTIGINAVAWRRLTALTTFA
jgi:hypothetical protein